MSTEVNNNLKVQTKIISKEDKKKIINEFKDEKYSSYRRIQQECLKVIF